MALSAKHRKAISAGLKAFHAGKKRVANMHPRDPRRWSSHPNVNITRQSRVTSVK